MEKGGPVRLLETLELHFERKFLQVNGVIIQTKAISMYVIITIYLFTWLHNIG